MVGYRAVTGLAWTTRRHTQPRLVAGFVTCLVLAALAATAAPASAARQSAEAQKVIAATRAVMEEQHLKGAIVRVDRGRRNVVTAALGETMTGVPATKDMSFRMGSETIPYLTTILLQLQEEGKLSLDDPLSKHLPDSGAPNADRVTLRMLGHATSGYPDWIQGNPAFVDLLLADPFRLWSEQELLDHAFAQPLICEPGECFHYAHTNFLLLGRVVSRVTGKPFATLVRERIFKPLRLRHTTITRTAEMPAPVLHAYGTDRGPYEDTSFWSPSWGLGNGQLMVSTIDDVAKSARGVLGAKLITKASERELVQLPPVAKAPIPGVGFGLGLVVAGDWRVQNPYINNYAGVMAYLPAERLSVAIVSTRAIDATFDGSNTSEVILRRIAEALTPGHPMPLGVPGAP
jgi:CubicO group peptidase (beta-lactamase class C family)